MDSKLLEEVTLFDGQFVKKGLVFRDTGVDAYLDKVGRSLLGGHPAPERVAYRFGVLRDPMVNAFALPNGSIYVTTGLLALLENEAQLASVLGHEITHVVNRHTYLENRSSRKKILTINILSAVSSSMPGGSLFGAVVALGADLSSAIIAGTIFGYSRNMEREADTFGIKIMSQASYDPRAMPRTFELLDERLEFEPIENFYRTHPRLAERRESTIELASGQVFKDARVGTEDEYLTQVAPAICANIEADLNSRRARTAVARAQRLAKWRPDEPNYQVLLADSYRVLSAKPAEPTEEEVGRHGQAEHRKQYFKLTEEEEQNQLAKKPDGAATRKANYEKSEQVYRAVLEKVPTCANAHRGLGFLLEQEARPSEAAAEYRRYLGLTAGTTLDRARIERRLAAVDKAVMPQRPSQP